MARLKTSSKDYDKAVRRLAAVKNINANFDLGNGLVAASYETAIGKVRSSMDTYNTALSKVDGLLNQLKAHELELKDWNERILMGVAAKYGKNSSEYEQAGGVRKSERKKPQVQLKSA